MATNLFTFNLTPTGAPDGSNTYKFASAPLPQPPPNTPSSTIPVFSVVNDSTSTGNINIKGTATMFINGVAAASQVIALLPGQSLDISMLDAQLSPDFVITVDPATTGKLVAVF